MGRPRKRVYAIHRGPDGSAFQNCEICGVSVAIALADMHDCVIKRNAVKKLKTRFGDEPLLGQMIHDQPRSPFLFHMEEFMKDHEGNEVETYREGFEKWQKMSAEERKPFVLQAFKLNSAHDEVLLKEENEIQSVDDEADSSQVGKCDMNYKKDELVYDSDDSEGSGVLLSETSGSFDSEDLFQARPWVCKNEG